MLCSNQQCSYTHWILHANYPSVKQKNKNISSSRDKQFYDKKRVIISKLLNEYKSTKTSKKKLKHDQHQFKFQTNTRKYSSQESILIPKDPTSPYAFTLNVSNINKRNKKYFVNQVNK